ncbi:RsiV family protein [Anaerotignum sp.]|uniref:RsiV family protein n=1 Tax=Anaerotignum sp. TaxID=2039241 RepID=UPI002A91C185|nr:RsiV family protein [Anaerotignum sp.]MCI7658354.1 RsiV family protein [Clostridia bacterium]MDY5415703.1 RsiV family protein [Anaerotignum sp.]
MKKYWHWKKTTGLLMAWAVACGTTGTALAEERQEQVSAVERVRTYEGDEGDMILRINVPQVVGKEGYAAEVNEEILKLTTDYEARADWEVAQYKEAFLATGGTEKEFADKDIQVYVDYDVKSETEDQVSFVLQAYNTMSKIDYIYQCYNVNLKDNSEITLEELLGPDYINIANETIKEQIAADDSGLYFEEEMGGFTTITPETQFYINEAGNPVIVFQKYEIAAGAAGMPEFEIAK